MPTTLLRPRTLPYAGVTVLVALALAGCGGGSSTTSAPAPAAGSTPAPTGTAGAGQRQPGTTGLIAAVTGSTMQVQTRTDQTAVSWTDATTFTRQVAATLGDVTTGSCVTVLEPQSTGAATTTPGTAAAAPTSVTAATVQVRPASNGQCAGGFAGGAGAGGAGAPTGAPTRTGTAGPDGSGGTGTFGRRGTSGLVTAVSGSTITVQATMRAGTGGATTGTATASGGTTQTVTVTTTGSTTYLAQQSAAATDVAVGECVTAIGKADDTGSVAATAVSLQPATNGQCATGGMGRPTGSATTGSANG